MSKPINGVIDGEWKKHLRPYGKRAFWKRHRKAELDPPDTCAKPAKRGKKCFGLILVIKSAWFKDFSYTYWYATEAARDKAGDHFMKTKDIRKIER